MPGLSRTIASTVVPVAPRDAVERVAGAHDDGRGAGPRRGRDGAGRGLVLPEAGANDEHGDGDGEEESHGRRDPGDRRAIDVHQPAAAQTALREARRLRARDRAPVLRRRVAVRVDHRARGVDEGARRAAREGARDVGRLRTLGADPGQKDDRARHRAAGVADDARHGRADDRADAREPARADEVLAPRVDELGDVPPDGPSVRERRVLQLGGARRSTCGRGGRARRRRGDRRRGTGRASRGRGTGSR